MRQLGRGIPGVAAVLGLMLVVASMPVPAAAADVVIDDFGDAQPAVPPLTAPPTATDFVDETVGTMVGSPGERDLRLSLLSGTGPVTAEVSTSQLQFDVMAGDRGELLVTWDGDDDSDTLNFGLGPADLVDSTNNTLRITVDAVAGIVELVVELFTDASNSSRAAATVTATGDVYLPFSSFTPNRGSGLASFASVAAITLQIRAGTATGGAMSCDLSDFRAIGPGVTALKTDALLTDVDMDGKADPGDTLEYEVEITADGGATGVELDDTPGLSSGLTFQSSSIEISPVAVNDGYTAAGNVQLSIPAVSGLLANDFDPDTNLDTPPIAAPLPTTSLQGGMVSVTAADGSFTYTPPSMFSGVDSFTYTLIDQDGLTDTATVNIHVDGVIWFVDDTAGCGVAPCGSGTQADPFKGFHPTQLNGAGGAGDVDGENDIIFVFEGSGNTDTGDIAGLELENGQTLHGEGEALVISGQTIVAAGTNPTLTNTAGTAGHGITLAEDNTIRGLSVGDTSAGGWAFRATAVGGPVGTLTIEDTDVAGAGGIFNLPSGTGGTLDVTFDSVASTSIIGGGAIEVQSASGSFTVENPGAGIDTSIAGEAGISIQDSPGASFSFGETDLTISLTGGDAIDLGGTTPSAGATFTFDSLTVTTGDNGLLGRGASTLNIGGTASTIAATGGAAVDIEDMALDNGAGGGGLTFASLTSTGSASDGIRLDSTTGTFTVTGTVDIDDPTSDGIDISGVNGAGNSVTFGGGTKSITDTPSTGPDGGTGVRLTNSDVDFTGGGLDIDTTTGIGLSATGGGTLNVTGAGNTVDVSGAATHALDLNGVTIGANDVTFASITATGGVTAEGIDIDATTNAGVFNGGDVTLTGTQGNGIDINGSSAAFSFSSANLTNSTGAGINLAGMNGVVTFSAVDIDGSGGAALQVTGNSSAVNVNGGTIGSGADNGSASAASVDIDNAAADVTVAASIANSADRAVEITGSGVGTLTFSGAIDEDGTGIRLDNNDQGGNATINFRGGLALDTGANTAFTATNGGLVEVCDDTACNGTGTSVANTIGAGTALSAVAVNFADTDFGASGVTFTSLDTDGAPSGITLTNAAGSGGGFFEVSGDGASDPADTTRGRTTAALGGGTLTLGSGGSILNSTAAGVVLNNADDVTLRNLVIQDAAANGVATGEDGIDLSGGSSGITFDNLLISSHAGNHGVDGSSVSDVVFQHTEVSSNATAVGTDGPDIHNVRFDNLTGTSSATNSLFHTSRENIFSIFNSTGTLGFTGTNIEVRDTNATAPGNVGLLMDLTGSAVINATISGSSFLDNRARGVQFLSNSGTANGSVNVRTSVFERSFVPIDVAHQAAGQTVTFDIDGNDINMDGGVLGEANAINVVLGGVSTATTVLSGCIRNNDVGEGTLGGSGSFEGVGILTHGQGAGTLTALVQGNTVRAIEIDNGFVGLSSDHTGFLNLTFENNDIDVNPGSFPIYALDLTAGAAAGDSGTLRANFAASSRLIGETSFGKGIQLLSVVGTPTIEIQGYGGADNDTSAIATFVDTVNGAPPAPSGTSPQPADIFRFAGTMTGTVSTMSGTVPLPTNCP